MKFSLDSLVKDLLKDERAVEVLEKYAPGLAKNPLIGFVKGKTLKSLLSMPQVKKAGITEDVVEKFLEEINEKE